MLLPKTDAFLSRSKISCSQVDKVNPREAPGYDSLTDVVNGGRVVMHARPHKRVIDGIEQFKRFILKIDLCICTIMARRLTKIHLLYLLYC